LVDLTGFTQTSRSGIAALHPAPININWLGFAGTMGEISAGKISVGEISAGKISTPTAAALQDTKKALFDYLLSDAFITPVEATPDYAEKLLLLPDCYQPNDRKRPVGKTPSRESCQLVLDSFVFCCFNQTFKITPEVFAVWMRLLKAKPNSVLWLLDCNQWAKQNLIIEAEKSGVSAEKLVFAPRIAIADHLARHVHADLFLDTMPYNAHTTCSDALWMGVPVLTCTGDTFSARVAGSLLQASGLNKLITYTLQDYENKALYLASNPKILTEIKQKLLAEKMTSALFDTANFAKALEASYQTIWQNYLSQ
jgi:predicted O-linked N-acetylglucosamine transferase (SPINDLY family)